MRYVINGAWCCVEAKQRAVVVDWYVSRYGQAAQKVDLVQFYQHDLDWHRKLWVLSGNAYLADVLERLVVPLFAFFLVKNKRERRAYVESAVMHGKIVAALQNESAAEARKLMKESLRGWKDDMIQMHFKGKREQQ